MSQCFIQSALATGRQDLQLARQGSNADYGVLYIGQTSGLINSIQPAGEIVTGMVREAEAILGQHIPRLLAGGQGI